MKLDTNSTVSGNTNQPKKYENENKSQSDSGISQKSSPR